MKAASVAMAAMVGCAFAQSVSAADTVTYKEKVLYSFCTQRHCSDGAYPTANLIDLNGILYGTSSGGGNRACAGGCGTVFSYDRSTGAETVLYNFCSQPNCADGASPHAGLININGTLYGTTFSGGSPGCNGYGCGTLFSIDPNTGVETLLYSFCSQSNCTDGASPFAGLTYVNGTLYGATIEGGVGCGGSGCGTLFSLDTSTGAEKVLYSFCSQQNCSDGAYPGADLIDVNGTLYGTAGGGSGSGCTQTSGCGTVFSFDLTSGAEKVIYSFCSQENCPDGSYPDAGLLYVNGLLYGTTTYGGGTGCFGSGCGTVFALDPSTGMETVVYSFCKQQNCTDGANPFVNLIDVKGTLFGTTNSGGADDDGTVFSVDPTTGAEMVIHSFAGGLDGAGPDASLIHVKDILYGTTLGGGGGCTGRGCGTAFMLKRKR